MIEQNEALILIKTLEGVFFWTPIDSILSTGRPRKTISYISVQPADSNILMPVVF